MRYGRIKRPPKRLYDAMRVCTAWWTSALAANDNSAYCASTSEEVVDHHPSHTGRCENFEWPLQPMSWQSCALPSASHHGPLLPSVFHFPHVMSCRHAVLQLLADTETPLGKILKMRIPVEQPQSGDVPVNSSTTIVRQGQETIGARLLPAKPSHWMKTRWCDGDLLDQCWAGAIADARRERLTTLRGKYPPRYECGVHGVNVVLQAQKDAAMKHSNHSHATTTSHNLNMKRRTTSSSLLRTERLLCDLARYRDYLPDRSRLFELENWLQEVGLSELVLEALTAYDHSTSNDGLRTKYGERRRIVIDVGGGNGYLATHLRTQLNISSSGGTWDAIVVDPMFPAHSLDSPKRYEQWDETQDRAVPLRWSAHLKSGAAPPFRRLVQFAETVEWDADIGTLPSDAVLVSKHLCGTALDRCLRSLDLQGRLPRVLVLSPCCYNKGLMHEYVHPTYLETVLGISTPAAWDAVTKLTDWHDVDSTCGCRSQKLAHRTLSEQEGWTLGEDIHRYPTDTPHSESLNAPCDGDVSSQELIPHWKPSPSKHPYGKLTGLWTSHMSQVVHCALDEGRLQWLRERGYDAELVEFTPSSVTPKNVALVATYRGSRRLLA